jgi:DNA polymerase III delta subunit
MIYLLYGTDTEKSKTKLHALVAAMLSKKPDAVRVRYTAETISEASFDELVGGMGLFSEKMIVECDRVLEDKEYKDQVLARLKECAASENIFIFREVKLLKAELKSFEKHAQKIQEFEGGNGSGAVGSGTGVVYGAGGNGTRSFAEKKDGGNFALADAFGQRDKKQLWMLYANARLNDVAAEELHGIIFWQLKSMILAGHTASASEANINPYVYQKSKKYVSNYTQTELESLSYKLVDLYHQARRGSATLDAHLEAFILAL